MINHKNNYFIKLIKKIISFVSIICIIILFLYIVCIIFRFRFWEPHEYSPDRCKQDCDILVQAIQKYNNEEKNTTVKDTFMIELKNSKYASYIETLYKLHEASYYVSDIEKIHDRWGNRYEHDFKRKIVFSKGYDQKHNYNDINSLDNRDDICIPYVGKLTLVNASIEINPNNNNKITCYDRLHLFFNKEVALPTYEINLKSALTDESNVIFNEANPCIFIYYAYYNDKTPLKPGNPNDDPLGDLPIIKANDVTYGNDYNELVLKFPQGYSSINNYKKLFIPNAHYINIVGNSTYKNKVFYEKNGNPENDWAVEAPERILIKKYE